MQVLTRGFHFIERLLSHLLGLRRIVEKYPGKYSTFRENTQRCSRKNCTFLSVSLSFSLFGSNLTIGTCKVLIRKRRITIKSRLAEIFLPSSSSILDQKSTTERWNPVLTDMSINDDNHKLTRTLFFMIIVIPTSRTCCLNSVSCQSDKEDSLSILADK